MDVALAPTDTCTGCGACVNACEPGAITMTPLGDFGFSHPIVDLAQCCRCGQCTAACPVLNPVPSDPYAREPAVYAAWSLDAEMRLQSTSGGIFSELARAVLRDGGAVAGARYDAEHRVVHAVVDAIEDLHLLRQSKYVQSEIGLTYREVRIKLAAGRRVLFAGCPCQAAGLRSLLGEEDDRLTTVDFICRGVNSPAVYQRYLTSLARRHCSPIRRVWFKYKGHGWKRFHTRVEFTNGQAYEADRDTDWFMRGFIGSAQFLRECCYQCPYQRLPRPADITLGDFWGVRPALDDDLGTSMVMLNSPEGRRLFDLVRDKCVCEESSFAEVVRCNPHLLGPARRDPVDHAFFAELEDPR